MLNGNLKYVLLPFDEVCFSLRLKNNVSPREVNHPQEEIKKEEQCDVTKLNHFVATVEEVGQIPSEYNMTMRALKKKRKSS